MRVAVLSDIHANFEALDAVLLHAGEHGVERFVCLGDVIGYGASPNECIARLQDLPNCISMLGNHDAALLGLPSPMGRETRRTITWTRRVLGMDGLWYIRDLQDTLLWNDVVFCHSNPYRPRSYHYVAEKRYISSSFARSRAKLIFVGHTHVPLAITRRNFFCVYLRAPLHTMEVPVASRNRQLFNCGAVGQPRDGDPRASYLIYDNCRAMVEFYRVPYDVEAAAARILAAGLPEFFAKRLYKGE